MIIFQCHSGLPRNSDRRSLDSKKPNIYSIHVKYLKNHRQPSVIRLPFKLLHISSVGNVFTMGSHSADILRIASASGSVTDRRHGLAELARTEDVQFIVGDWMSEYNMTTRGGGKVLQGLENPGFEQTFVESIEPALENLASRKIKVAVNAGASDTKKLHDTMLSIITNKKLDLKVAWVEGDEVTDLLQEAMKAGEQFKNLTTGKPELKITISSGGTRT